MTTIKDLVRDDVVTFLAQYENLDVAETDIDALVDEIMETVNEQISKVIGL